MRESETVAEHLRERFGETLAVPPDLPGAAALARIAGHRTYRRYAPRPVDADLLRLLCACALSAPTKSDLQQADILIVSDPAKRTAIADLIPDQAHVRDAPAFLIFLANGARVPATAALRGKPFPNDHLDAFFNATVDAALTLATFIAAAEAAGLGCCPISVIRDHAATVSDLFALPDRVVPLSGLCLGWPAEERRITPRLGLDVTLHEDRYGAGDLAAQVEAYDRRRHAVLPYGRPRDPQRWGTVAFYGWSEDKARQYAVPQRADFGAFVRGKGFRLD
jgi:nitroreductase